MRAQATYRIGIAMAVGMILAGCASEAPSSSSPASPGSPASPASPARSVEPSPEIPREPGDQPPATGWVTGIVTRGGTGPCYGLTADDGKEYALYGTGGIELTKGDRIRVQLETTLLRIYCGPGTLMAMTAAEPIK